MKKGIRPLTDIENVIAREQSDRGDLRNMRLLRKFLRFALDSLRSARNDTSCQFRLGNRFGCPYNDKFNMDNAKCTMKKEWVGPARPAAVTGH